MTTLFRRGAMVLGLTVVAGATADAQTYNFGYSGSVVSWVVPASGSYFLDAIGAQGGTGFTTAVPPDSPPLGVGGLGAEIGGVFNLTAGDILQIAVGGMGASGLPIGPQDPSCNSGAGGYCDANGNGGGGGGSFITSVSNPFGAIWAPVSLIDPSLVPQDPFASPLVVAGGGGGIGDFTFQNGCNASITQFAGTGSGASNSFSCGLKTAVGSLGQGGAGDSFNQSGGGGAGYFSNGSEDSPGDGIAQDWFNGLAGGSGEVVPDCSSAPGFGFGGGGSGTGCNGAGGGGGYSGGDGGYIAGGGGSYNGGFTQLVANAGVGQGNGSVYIMKVPDVSATPEPASMLLLGTGLVSIAGFRRKRRSVAETE